LVKIDEQIAGVIYLQYRQEVGPKLFVDKKNELEEMQAYAKDKKYDLIYSWNEETGDDSQIIVTLTRTNEKGEKQIWWNGSKNGALYLRPDSFDTYETTSGFWVTTATSPVIQWQNNNTPIIFTEKSENTPVRWFNLLRKSSSDRSYLGEWQSLMVTNESFLNAMPANIKAIHENSATATQEQKDAHDKWLVDAWKAIFSNLTDEQLAGMNLKRADIASLDFARTGKTYTQVWIHGVGTYPIYDYSLLQAVKDFSQEFHFNEPTMMIEFWEALKTKQGGDWSKYLTWNKNYGHEGFGDWSFHYAIDGTILHDIPIPGLDGVVADMAVRAYYYDVNGNEQTTLIAKVLKLPDGTLLNPLNQTTTRAEIDKAIPQLYDLGSVPGIDIVAEEENVIKLFPGKYLELPGVQAYLKFIKANKTALEEFLKTGSPTLKIIVPMGEGGSGGRNILHGYPNVGPPTPTP